MCYVQLDVCRCVLLTKGEAGFTSAPVVLLFEDRKSNLTFVPIVISWFDGLLH